MLFDVYRFYMSNYVKFCALNTGEYRSLCQWYYPCHPCRGGTATGGRGNIGKDSEKGKGSGVLGDDWTKDGVKTQSDIYTFICHSEEKGDRRK